MPIAWLLPIPNCRRDWRQPHNREADTKKRLIDGWYDQVPTARRLQPRGGAPNVISRGDQESAVKPIFFTIGPQLSCDG